MNAQMAALRDLIYGAVNYGADLDRICSDLGIEPGDLNNSEKQITTEQSAKVWSVLLHHTKDPLLGLHLGEKINPTIHGMLGYLMQTCRTVYDSTIMLCKYSELVTPVLRFSAEATPKEFAIVYEPSVSWQHVDPEGTRQSIETAMAGALAITKALTGRKVYPIKVDLAYPPRLVKEYERVFQSGIHFNSKQSKLSFDKEVAATPILSHDKSLFEFFDRTLDQELKSIRGDEQLSDRIKHLILNDFKGQIPSLEITSAKLNMTPRSLQRKLKEDQTTYREIVTDVKKELAKTLMKSDFRVGEVAEILGYSNSSAFRKAFKKWSDS